MAKKEKDKKKKKTTASKPAAARAASLGRVGGGPAGAVDPADEMRRIAREAAWARMFGKNSGGNPFTGRT
jgi:hypothetical protein